jgi:shikimate kinase
MGTGKTTVTRELAKLTGMAMVDTDEYIESAAKMTIPEIFAQKGEGYFRDLESESIVSILSKGNQLISCGGGIILRDENVKYMKDKGKIILLTASAEAF